TRPSTSSSAHRPRRRSRRVTTERLCLLSSALPCVLVPEHGVDDREELMSRGNESQLGWFARGSQPLVEGPNSRVASAGGKSCHVKRGADGMAAARNVAFAPHRS